MFPSFEIPFGNSAFKTLSIEKLSFSIEETICNISSTFEEFAREYNVPPTSVSKLSSTREGPISSNFSAYETYFLITSDITSSAVTCPSPISVKGTILLVPFKFIKPRPLTLIDPGGISSFTLACGEFLIVS